MAFIKYGMSDMRIMSYKRATEFSMTPGTTPILKQFDEPFLDKIG